MWVGGVADSQTRSKPLKTPQNCPENRLFRPKFHLSFSQISQKPWGGWVGKQIWERYPKKNGFFFGSFPYNIYVLLFQGPLFLYVLCANSFFRHFHPHCLCPFFPFLRPLIGGRPRLFLIGLIFSNPDNSGTNRQWGGQKKNAQKASCLKKLRKLHFATQCRIVSPF